MVSETQYLNQTETHLPSHGHGLLVRIYKSSVKHTFYIGKCLNQTETYLPNQRNHIKFATSDVGTFANRNRNVGDFREF